MKRVGKSRVSAITQTPASGPLLLVTTPLKPSATVGTEALAKASRDQADVLFRPPLEAVDLLDWRACDRAIDTGYRHAIEQLERLDKPAVSAS